MFKITNACRGFALRINKGKITRQIQHSKIIFLNCYLGREGFWRAAFFLTCQLKGTDWFEKKKQLTVLITHLSNVKTFCTYTNMYIFLIKNATNPVIKLKMWQEELSPYKENQSMTPLPESLLNWKKKKKNLFSQRQWVLVQLENRTWQSYT